MTLTIPDNLVPEKDGRYGHVPEDAYHQDRGSLSVSGAKLLLPPSCPAKFHEIMTNGQPPKKVWDFGHVAHHLVLGKGSAFKVLDPEIHGLKADGTVAASPRATTDWRNAEKDARAQGLIPIHIDDYTKAKEMAEKVHKHPEAAPIFQRGHAEVSYYRTDPDTGTRLRCRVDWINEEITDYKTSDTANPEDLERKFHRLGYYMQAAWYIDLVTAITGTTAPRFRFVVQEKTAPYVVTVLEYDTEAIEEGRRRNREAIHTYTACMETNTWPGYSDETVTLSLPHWAFDDELEIAV
ncbi:PD-(D/E)XK nuclease-like domain-containing protein [Mycolicibacterium houstonense]|uniref:PD-(D/E)XK nuclease-like domain-containing protein n=1 Tax=Mycolicibacterium houstonense TaxID=146021 RepID=UPI0008346DD8|nr:PD-(D/E)XK nuclease-like domain-containing protein [Mycolicibacterium houstonense]